MTIIICNQNQQDYFSQLNRSDIIFCTSEIEVANLINTEIEAVLIIAELDWPENKYSDFYGIELATQLRLKYKILSPLIICSFLDKKYFIKQNKIKYNILKVRGTGFLQIPFINTDIEKEIETICPLSKATLKYISNLLTDLRYLVDRITHDIRIEKSKDTLVRSLNLIDNQFRNFLMYSELKEISNNIIRACEQQNEDKFYALKKELIYHLNLYSQDKQRDNVTTGTQLKHKILLLDDNPADISWAVKALAPYFEITSVNYANDAIRLIDADVNNDFAAIICDWQLLYPNTEQQQNMLGFEVLEYASKRGIYALFSLTATDEFSLRQVNLELPFEHQLLTKDFQQGNALWKTYINNIQQKIDQNRVILASLPLGESWTNNFKLEYKKSQKGNIPYKRYFSSFKEQYIEKCNSINWYQYKNEINTESTKLWNYYKKALNINDRFEIFDLKSQWGIELNRELKNLLIIRRLYFAFWFNKMSLNLSFRVDGKRVEDPVINIYSILRMRYFEDMTEEYSEKEAYNKLLNAAKVFANQLSIEPKKLPLGLLPEERGWLNDMGIDVEKGNNNLYDDFE